MILKGHVITNCWLPEDSQQRTIIPDEVHLAGKFQPDALEKKTVPYALNGANDDTPSFLGTLFLEKPMLVGGFNHLEKY
jgi:hypothetical protein